MSDYNDAREAILALLRASRLHPMQWPQLLYSLALEQGLMAMGGGSLVVTSVEPHVCFFVPHTGGYRCASCGATKPATTVQSTTRPEIP